MDGWMIGRVGGPTDRMDRWFCRPTDGRMDWQMDGWEDRWTGGWMDGWEGGRKNARKYVWTDR